MQTYECATCGSTRPETEFRVIRGRRIKHCRPCHNERIYEWRRNNPKRVKSHKHRYHETHKEKINQKVRAWQEENRDRTVDLAHMGRARKYGAEKVELVERVKVYERDQALCHVCGIFIPWEDFQLDHIVPLSGGGDHTYENVKASHRICNLQRRSHGGTDPV